MATYLYDDDHHQWQGEQNQWLAERTKRESRFEHLGVFDWTSGQAAAVELQLHPNCIGNLLWLVVHGAITSPTHNQQVRAGIRNIRLFGNYINQVKRRIVRGEIAVLSCFASSTTAAATAT